MVMPTESWTPETAPQEIADFYLRHLQAYRPFEESDETCRCSARTPAQVAAQFFSAMESATDNTHPNGEHCQHPLGKAVEDTTAAILAGIGLVDWRAPKAPDGAPPAWDDEQPLREHARDAFNQALGFNALLSFSPCGQCREHTERQLIQQVKNAYGNTVNYPHGDDTVCNHPIHRANRQLVYSIYLGIDDAVAMALVPLSE